MYYYGNSFGWSPFEGILSFFVWMIVIIVIISLFRHMNGSRWHRWDRWNQRNGNGSGNGSRNGNGTINNSALDLLNERYVKGEITKEEYESKKKDITS